MIQKTNISVIKFSEEAEYTGELIVEMLGDGAKCSYDLVNFLDTSKRFKGEFECVYSGLAPIIEKIEKLINALSESN